MTLFLLSDGAPSKSPSHPSARPSHRAKRQALKLARCADLAWAQHELISRFPTMLAKFATAKRRRRRRDASKEGHRTSLVARYTACCLVLGLSACSAVFITAALLYLADDGSGRYGESASPSTLECLHAAARIRTAQNMHPELDMPINRVGSGVIVLSAPGTEGFEAEAIIRRALYLQRASSKASITCCGRSWNLRIRAHRQTVLHSSAWPFVLWAEHTAYHPFVYAAVPTAASQAVVVVSDPVSRLVRTWHGPVEDLVARLSNRSTATGPTLDVAATYLVGNVDSDDRCFSYAFHQRLTAIARGHWLPYVVERSEESIALLAHAYQWEPAALLPPKYIDSGPSIDQMQRQILAGAQPFDTKLHDLANNVLSAWQAKVGSPFSVALNKLRQLHRFYHHSCANITSNFSTKHAFALPREDVCVWLGAPGSKRQRLLRSQGNLPWTKPKCTVQPAWTAWCFLASPKFSS